MLHNATGVSMEVNLLTSLSDNIRIDRDKCSACGKCAEVCILDNLRLQLSPCRHACPLGMNCQGYIHYLAHDKAAKGTETIRESTPFGGILGRICSRPCEAACNRIKVDGEAVAIRDLKRFLSDRTEAPILYPTGAESGKSVAIAGAGPAGLTAAFILRSAGHRVTLYDREPTPGGLLRWAIPEFRLPYECLDRELAFLKVMNVDFQGERTLGQDLDLEGLKQQFDAVLLTLGAHGQAKLGVPGEDSDHVIPLLSFMKMVRQGQTPSLGQKVVVVGGGNGAIDAAQTALRLGTRNVTLVCLEKRHEMAAFPWSISEAEEEGVIIHNGWGPRSFHYKAGRLSVIGFKKCTALCDAKGCFCPSYDEEATMELPCDTVIVAIGQTIEEGWAGIVHNPVTLQSENPKVFVAGDLASRAGTVVEAMAQGKEAAISIDRILKGEDPEYGRRNGRAVEIDFSPDWSRARSRARVVAPVLPMEVRKGFEEIAKGLPYEQAVAEAERCLGCGIPFGLRTCWFCLPCEIECPEQALHVEIPYLLR